jgi:hypothetical protein
VYLDPSARGYLDYHTARYGFVIERQSKQGVQERYEVSDSQWAGWQHGGGVWVSKDECLVADYYCREETPITLVRLPDGPVRYVPVLTQTDDEVEQQRQQELLQIVSRRLARHGIYPLQAGEETAFVHPGVQRRPSTVPVVWWYKINGQHILEQTLWQGQYIPIIPVLGEEFVSGDEVDYQGMVRQGRGLQDEYNYVSSTVIETVAQMPRVPYIGQAGIFDGHPEWFTINTQPHPYAEYNSLDAQNLPAQPPQRQIVDTTVQGIAALKLQTAQEFYDLLGVYPPSLGEPSNEKSGIAIRRRQAAGSLGMSHYTTSMSRGMCYETIQLLDLIPHVWHEPHRVARVLGEDMTQEMIQVQPGRGAPQLGPTPAHQMPDGQTMPAQPLPEGISGIYDLTAGRYDVVVKPGPSYETKQEETAAQLTELAQVVPMLGQVIPDLLVATQNFEGSDEAVRRLKRIPQIAQLLDPEDTRKPEERAVVLEGRLKQMEAMGQQMQAQMQQMGQEYHKMQQENSQLKLRLEAKHADIAVDQQELADQRRVDQEKLHLERERFEFEKLKWQHEQEWRRYQAEREQQQRDNEGGEPKETGA